MYRIFGCSDGGWTDTYQEWWLYSDWLLRMILPLFFFLSVKRSGLNLT